MRRFLFTAICVLLAVSAATAADVTGKWSGAMPTRDGGTRDVTFTFKQAGDSLTGSMSAFDNEVPIKDGKVDGDNISYTVTLDFNGNTFKILFEGKVQGGTLEMTREREGSGNKQKFSLKKG